MILVYFLVDSSSALPSWQCWRSFLTTRWRWSSSLLSQVSCSKALPWIVGLPQYTCIVAAPRIAAMRKVFEYTHLYIRIQTNIHKNEMPYLFAALEINDITSKQQSKVLKCLHFTLWAHDYLYRWVHEYLYRLIPVELGYRSCLYKVKRRSGFQIVRADLSK